MRLGRNPARGAAELAYRRVVEQARRPEFFTLYGVPDTLDGRFELVCLHAFFYLHRLKGEPGAAAVGQHFFDAMCTDFDRSLRELGTGDLSVGKQVMRMAEGFYGRARAYENALAEGGSALDAALLRNLYGTAPANPAQLGRMTEYVRREVARLAGEPAATLASGAVRFAEP